MAIDIQGWLEFSVEPDGWEGASPTWEGVFNLGWTCERDYDLFGLLFGVRGHGLPGLQGLTQGRPEHLSPSMLGLLADYPADMPILVLPWAALSAVQRNGRTLELQRSEIDVWFLRDGAEERVGRTAGTNLLTPEQEVHLCRTGEEQRAKDYVYRRILSPPEKLELADGWNLLFQVGDFIAARFAPRNLRLVAFFE